MPRDPVKLAAKSRRHYLKHRDRKIAKTYERIRRNQAWVYQYLMEHPCSDCGEQDPIVLEFDHVRGVKDKAVSALTNQGYALKRVIDEAKKCDVRCANCHRRRTAAVVGNYKTKTRE